ncbi:PAS domain-containing protein [Alteriqipengyuania flavescens]|uniref:sensor histidine kinase n=1 Tax=Alteriqipengyuania flavescens TaxID=3053610 RepID=UPI0025B29AD4|nr:PAS domain-containing protein [Alteriqipengyuania flavescens]WJY19882.1 PAS domain-containing protein [Alteriqipengyuania flavescens]WJY25824.1 PAS domain-containing protein [Alteriqipengyuania flavescens]
MSDTNFFKGIWQGRIESPDFLPPLPGEPSDEDFRCFAASLPTLCWMARGDGYIVWYNQRWYDYTGTTPQEMEGWGWEKVHDPAVLNDVKVRWQRSINEAEPFEMVFPLRGADGVFRPFLTRISPVTDPSGKVVRWFGVNTEIGAQMRAETQRDESRAEYKVLTNAMPQMVWSTRPDGYHDFYNDKWYEFTGVPQGSTDGEAWKGLFHPDDQERAWTAWRHSLATGDPYEIEYRLRDRHGAYRWVLGRASPVYDNDGSIRRWIGTCTDIHEAKQVSEHNEVLSRELAHRIKNIFAIIAGLIGLSARNEPSARAFARQLSQRIVSLGRAHDFARPHSDRSRPGVGDITLHGLLESLLEPYQNPEGTRIRATGDDVAVDDRGATPLALLIHELATNASKYGALSHPDGFVELRLSFANEHLKIEWREVGGPPVEAQPESTGFGSQLVKMSVEQQLFGSIAHHWKHDGLIVEVTLPEGSLVRTITA